MNQRLFNFSAGPATVPETVLKAAQKAIWTYADTGIGILEHSHRGSAFRKVLADAEENCRKLADIDETYDVLFLPGGASTQFFMIPMNWLSSDKIADYIDTGKWSSNAIKEANILGNTNVAASSLDQSYKYIPKNENISWSDAPSYAHYTSNNTIAGTQYSTPPTVPNNVPLVCDASSDIFSRPFEINKHSLVYMGGQKNLGPSGISLVIARKSFIEKGNPSLPSMLQYRTHASANSCFNTPPTFGIYLMGEVFKWILAQGGLSAMEELNKAKASLLYNFLDESPFFSGVVQREDRSLMNITFHTPSKELDSQFVTEASENGLPGLAGHRSVGGMRASIYNAFPTAGVTALVEFMKKFELSHR